ncbi:ABC transporter substrate-binding protein [Pollutimonas subterranea]|uniref:ABC transporter substrate-binding protein n=1 Tax=Pollutimonas subterranea TaxID=2045210 RepID=A0A2N4U7H8_9BURK|nr:tripartite tricarboxylate transporter substrate binding protein [Pollutimonas subterranea]PLC50980.1 ABC transporter substrate-binding protein [Pollutimonas subterranea]
MKHYIALATISLAICGLGGASSALAESTYPERPIRLVVTSAPGSGLDTVARTISDDMGKALKQSVVVENKAGAAGIPGTKDILASTPNGYTLGLVSSNHAVNPSLNDSLPYDSVNGLTAITLLGHVPVVLAVPANSPYKTVQDLIDAAEQAPGSIDYGSSGAGSALHLASVLLETKARIKMMHIPYKGGSALTSDLISGQIDTAFLAVPTAYGQIKAGTLRALAVSTTKRLELLPDVATLDESGVKDYEYVPWIGLIGPPGLDKNITELLQKTVAGVIQLPHMKTKFDAQGFMPAGSTSDAFKQLIKDDVELSAKLVKQAGTNSKS